MVHISKPLTAGKAQAYYRSEYSAAENSYYTQGKQLQGQWHGEFARENGLTGAVQEIHFDRMAEGQNPATGEQWVGHRDSYKTREGSELQHRAGFDLTFNAPKTVSLIALPGHDDRVRSAHAEAVKAALDAGQEYMQARMGGDHPSQTTGKWAAAQFEHDTARPENGYPAPHLHTHVVVFNMTRTEDGQVRSMQPTEIFRIQSYMTAVYQNDLATRLKSLGYELTPGTNHAPDIKGFTKEYLEAESQRSQRIKLEMQEKGLEGRAAEEKIAHSAREAKLAWTPEQVHAAHRAHQEEFGGQADKLYAESLQRPGVSLTPENSRQAAKNAVDFALNKLSERTAVFDQFEVHREALWHRQGKITLDDIRREIAARQEQGQLIAASHVREHAPGQRFTTVETVAMERDLLRKIIATKETRPQLESWTAEETAQRFPHLNQAQQTAMRHVMSSRDQFGSFQGNAGVGKTTTMKVLREAFESHGFRVMGLAPTSGAAKELGDAGIESSTLQMHLTKPDPDVTQPRYYVVDESSLASTKQVSQFVAGLREQDRVLFVGDTKQHQSVEAGRIFAEMREAGIAGTTLRQIVRQQNPQLLAVVENLSNGKIDAAVNQLREQGRVQEVGSKNARYAAIAKDYVTAEGKVLVVSPDNESRRLLNAKIRGELQGVGRLGNTQVSQEILVVRQDLTKEDRKAARAYRPDDVVKFHKANKAAGMDKGEYASVISVNDRDNTLTVRTTKGLKTYNPERAFGVQIYEKQQRQYAEGERVQLTAPWKEKGLPNRQVGTFEKLDSKGNAILKLDEGRRVAFNLKDMKHLDHGYAVTSYSAQGSTVDKVIVQVSTTDTRVRSLVDQRLAYVAVSRARHDVQIYTDKADGLASALGRKSDKTQGLHPDEVKGYRETAVAIRTNKRSLGISF